MFVFVLFVGFVVFVLFAVCCVCNVCVCSVCWILLGLLDLLDLLGLLGLLDLGLLVCWIWVCWFVGFVGFVDVVGVVGALFGCWLVVCWLVVCWCCWLVGWLVLLVALSVSILKPYDSYDAWVRRQSVLSLSLPTEGFHLRPTWPACSIQQKQECVTSGRSWIYNRIYKRIDFAPWSLSCKKWDLLADLLQWDNIPAVHLSIGLVPEIGMTYLSARLCPESFPNR